MLVGSCGRNIAALFLSRNSIIYAKKYINGKNMTTLARLSSVENVSERIIRILGCNPGPFTLQGTNTYLVGLGDKRILIDTGEANNEDYLCNLSKVLRENKVTLQEIIITHWHPDHCGGIPDVYKTLSQDYGIPITKFARKDKRNEVIEADISYTYVKDLHKFSTEGANLRALFTPGHSDDHMSLYFEEENAIFTGDTVLGEGTSTFEDLHSYMQSLDRILSFNSSRLYPAHGSVVEDPQNHLTMYINNRLLREKQILDCLKRNSECSISNIVDDVYKGLKDNLRKGAMSNVRHHLNKLIKDGVVDLMKKDEQELYSVKSSNL